MYWSSVVCVPKVVLPKVVFFLFYFSKMVVCAGPVVQTNSLLMVLLFVAVGLVHCLIQSWTDTGTDERSDGTIIGTITGRGLDQRGAAAATSAAEQISVVSMITSPWVDYDPKLDWVFPKAIPSHLNRIYESVRISLLPSAMGLILTNQSERKKVVFVYDPNMRLITITPSFPFIDPLVADRIQKPTTGGSKTTEIKANLGQVFVCKIPQSDQTSNQTSDPQYTIQIVCGKTLPKGGVLVGSVARSERLFNVISSKKTTTITAITVFGKSVSE